MRGASKATSAPRRISAQTLGSKPDASTRAGSMASIERISWSSCSARRRSRSLWSEVITAPWSRRRRTARWRSGVVEGVAGGVEAFEVAVGADPVGEPEAIELAPDVVVGLGDGEDDPALLELAGQLEHGLRAGVGDVIDRVRLQDEPARRIGDVHQAHDPPGESLRVGVEDPDPEPVDDKTRLGAGAGNG